MRMAMGLLLTVGLASRAEAQVCPGAQEGFSNLTTYTQSDHMLLGAGETNSAEHGNTITITGVTAPVARRITVSMRLFGGGVATYDARLRFYANDGPGHAPGTMLWTSDLIHALADSGAPTGFSTTVPNIALPATFTWTVQVLNRQGIPGELKVALYSPPTVGSAIAGVWERTGPNPSDWIQTSLNEAPFGMRICVGSAPGDVNCDGVADGADVNAFVTALIDPADYPIRYPGCDVLRADLNCDGVVNVADLDRFAGCLVNGSCGCS